MQRNLGVTLRNVYCVPSSCYFRIFRHIPSKKRTLCKGHKIGGAPTKHSDSFAILSLLTCPFNLQWPEIIPVNIRKLFSIRLIHSVNPSDCKFSRRFLVCLISWRFSQQLEFLCSVSLFNVFSVAHSAKGFGF